MRELTIKEILEYAENIELESYKFYSEAKKIVVDGEANALLSTLAEEETEHYNYLRKLLQESTLTEEDLNNKILLKESDLIKFVNTEKIEKDFTEKEILEIALEREIKTEQTYAMFMTFTQINVDILSSFEFLRNQEKGHVNKINQRLLNLK